MTSAGPWRRLAALAALAAVPLLLLGPIVLGGRLFLPQVPASLEPYRSEDPARAERALDGQNLLLSDRLFPFLTDQLAMREELRAGHLPTWEPLLGLGVPLFGGSLAGPAYPPNLLALLVPPERAAAPLAALSLMLAGAGAFLFLRRLGISTPAALFGALAYQLGGWGLANLFYFMKVDAALWFPWALWAVEGLARGRRGSGLALSLSIGLSLLAGMITVGAFVAFGTGLYALARFSARGEEPATLHGPPLLSAALFAALGAGISALWIVPAMEASGESSRQATSAEVIAAESLPATTALGIVLPDLFGDPTVAYPENRLPMAGWLTPASQGAKAQTANANEWNTYAGLAVFVLALTGAVARPRRARFPLLLLLGVIGFAQGWPGIAWLYHVPGLNGGNPARVLALAWFLWPWLAAIGVEALREGAPRARRTWLVASAALALLGSVLFLRSGAGPFADGLEARVIARYDEFESVEDVRAYLPRAVSLAEGERLRALLGRQSLVAAALLVLALAAGRARARRVVGALAFVVVLEGALAARGHVAGREPGEALFPTSATLEAVREAAGEGRVLRYAPEGLDEVLQLARPNLLQPLGVADATPWVVFVPRRLIELFESFDPASRERQGVARLSDARALDHPILDRMDVRAILARRPLASPVLEPVLEREGFCVYRRTSALGPARLVPHATIATSDRAGLDALATRLLDPVETVLLAPEHAESAEAALDHGDGGGEGRRTGSLASVERPSRHRLTIEVEDTEGAWLVVHQQHHPGWRATVDGEDTPLLRADHAFSALFVPDGSRRIELVYAPRSLTLGALVSLLCLATAALGSLRLGWDREGGDARPGAGQR